LTPNLRIVKKEVSIPLDKKDVEPRLKQMVKLKLLNRRKRPPTDGWRLNDEEFDKLNKT
jgi:RIO-like serine/threonine protein kinase